MLASIVRGTGWVTVPEFVGIVTVVGVLALSVGDKVGVLAPLWSAALPTRAARAASLTADCAAWGCASGWAWVCAAGLTGIRNGVPPNLF